MKKVHARLFAAVLITVLCRTVMAENEAWYYPTGLLFVPHVNLVDDEGYTVHSYAAFLQKEDRSWKFKLYGISPIGSATNGTVSTNMSGSWTFTFNEANSYIYNGTNFGQTTNMTPVSTNILLTLVQTNQTVSGTGLVSSVHYSLNGEVNDGLFWFHLLAGAANGTITVASGQAELGDGTLDGNYVWSVTNGTAVKRGTLSATQD